MGLVGGGALFDLEGGAGRLIFKLGAPPPAPPDYR